MVMHVKDLYQNYICKPIYVFLSEILYLHCFTKDISVTLKMRSWSSMIGHAKGLYQVHLWYEYSRKKSISASLLEILDLHCLLKIFTLKTRSRSTIIMHVINFNRCTYGFSMNVLLGLHTSYLLHRGTASNVPRHVYCTK